MARIIGKGKKKRPPWKKIPKQKNEREEELKRLQTTRMVRQGVSDQDAFAVASFINVEYIDCINQLVQKRRDLKKLKRKLRHDAKLERVSSNQRDEARCLEEEVGTLLMKKEMYKRETDNLCSLLIERHERFAQKEGADPEKTGDLPDVDRLGIDNSKKKKGNIDECGEAPVPKTATK